MKKLISFFLAACFTLSLTACKQEVPTNSNQTPPAESQNAEQNQPSGIDGKIAIITNTVSQNEEEYRSAQQVVEKYGSDKVIHVTWPDNFMTEQEQMVSIVSRLASDSQVKALVINQAVPGTNAAVDKLLETRDDIFIAYCTPQENPEDVSTRADLILMPDELEMGNLVPVQAQKLGAKTLVHYSFPRHMSQPLLSGRRDLMKAKCEEIGIEFVDATAPDPMGDAGTTGAQLFILEDVPKMIEKYGKDTAFFSTNCAMQVPLIKACVDEAAIYPQPCCPSPYHGFPTALGIETGEEMGDINYIISETERILGEKGVLGRFSTWPVPAAMMSTVAAAEYGIKWINGEVNKEEIDVEVLKKLMAEYAGTDEITLNPYTDSATGKTYPNYFFELMGFLTYGE